MTIHEYIERVRAEALRVLVEEMVDSSIDDVVKKDSPEHLHQDQELVNGVVEFANTYSDRIADFEREQIADTSEEIERIAKQCAWADDVVRFIVDAVKVYKPEQG